MVTTTNVSFNHGPITVELERHPNNHHQLQKETCDVPISERTIFDIFIVACDVDGRNNRAYTDQQDNNDTPDAWHYTAVSGPLQHSLWQKHTDQVKQGLSELNYSQADIEPA